MRRSLSALLLLASPLFAAAPPVPRGADDLPAGARLRLGSPRLRHGGLIRWVAVSPDGKRIASAGHDRAVSLWEVHSGKERFRLLGHRSDVTCLSFAPDGRTLASGSSDGTVRLWALDGDRAGTQLALVTARSDSVDVLAFSPDGKRLAVGGDDGALVVLDADLKKESFRKQIDRGVRALAWSGDGKWIATTGDGKHAVTLWDASNGAIARSFGEETIGALAFAPSGTDLVTWEDGGTMRLFDAATGKQQRKWGGDDSASLIYQIAFSRDGKSVFAGTDDGSVEEWEPATGKRRRKLAGLHLGRVAALAVRDGLLATGGADHAVRLHDLKTGKSLAPETERTSPIASLTTADGGKTLVALLNSGEVRLWERATGKPLETPKVGRTVAAAGRPEGKGLWLVNEEGKLSAYDLTKGSARAIEEDDPLAAVSTSADGKVVVGVLRNGMVPLFEAASGKRLHLAKGRERGATAVLSPDGAVVAVVGKAAAVALFSVKTGEEMTGVPGHNGGTLAAAFSLDGRWLATGGRDRYLRIWEMQTRKERVARIAHADWVRSAAFSPDGKLVATATTAGLVQLFDPTTGKLMAELPGHRGPVTGLTFADKSSLVSAGQDGCVIVWDVERVKRDGLAPRMLTKEQREALWAKMKDEDAIVAALAARELGRDPDSTVKLIAASVRPIDAKKVAKWIEELDDEKFAVRNEAFDGLAELGHFVEGALRVTLTKKPGLEQRRRIQELLAKLKQGGGDHVRALRAVELLEQIGSAAAVKLLKELAGGAADVELTMQAKASLERLKK